MRGEIPDSDHCPRSSGHIVFCRRAGCDRGLGLVLQHPGALPSVADKLEDHRWPFEIVDTEGRRIDKVLTTKALTPSNDFAGYRSGLKLAGSCFSSPQSPR
jgi:hypothetical protein